MNKIKSLSLGLLASVVLSGVALAAKNPTGVEVPVNQKSVEAHPLNAGFLHMRDSATAEMIVCSGRCLLAGIIMGTGPATSSVNVRNTSVANGSGALVLIKRFEASNTGYQSPVIPLPILLDKGITVTLPAASNGEEVTVLYRDMD